MPLHARLVAMGPRRIRRPISPRICLANLAATSSGTCTLRPVPRASEILAAGPAGYVKDRPAFGTADSPLEQVPGIGLIFADPVNVPSSPRNSAQSASFSS